MVFHPTLVTVTQTLDMTEGETTTGPNYVHNLTVTGTPASGQTLSDVVITHDVPGAVQVTAITPGGGGTLTALTLADGRTLTDPTLMQAAIASDTVFITRYTVSYTNVSAPISTVVSFYVPQSDANGQPILNPTTGAPVTIAFAAPTATGDWVPLDPRDSDPVGSQIDFTGTGSTEGGSFVATSITLSKTVTISTDAGSSGLSPGDTLAIRSMWRFRIILPLAKRYCVTAILKLSISYPMARRSLARPRLPSAAAASAIRWRWW